MVAGANGTNGLGHGASLDKDRGGGHWEGPARLTPASLPFIRRPTAPSTSWERPPKPTDCQERAFGAPPEVGLRLLTVCRLRKSWFREVDGAFRRGAAKTRQRGLTMTPVHPGGLLKARWRRGACRPTRWPSRCARPRPHHRHSQRQARRLARNGDAFRPLFRQPRAVLAQFADRVRTRARRTRAGRQDCDRGFAGRAAQRLRQDGSLAQKTGGLGAATAARRASPRFRRLP